MANETMMEKAYEKATASGNFCGYDQSLRKQIKFNGMRAYLEKHNAQVPDQEIRTYVDTRSIQEAHRELVWPNLEHTA